LNMVLCAHICWVLITWSPKGSVSYGWPNFPFRDNLLLLAKVQKSTLLSRYF
jgi:hypothetical protein